jgi:hypothetical protein
MRLKNKKSACMIALIGSMRGFGAWRTTFARKHRRALGFGAPGAARQPREARQDWARKIFSSRPPPHAQIDWLMIAFFEPIPGIRVALYRPSEFR